MQTSNGTAWHIAILGCGYMGTALLEGWLQRTDFTFSAYVKTKASCVRLQEKLSGYTDRVQIFFGNDLLKTTERAQLVLLGFLPGDLTTFAQDSALRENLRDKLVVSMLAGVSTHELEAALTAPSPVTPASTGQWKIARIIPTIGARIGESVTLIANPDSVPKSHLELVRDALTTIGSVQLVPESQMDAATAINAATHALAIVALDSITDASVASGVPRATASAIAAACLQSAGALFSPERGGMTPESMKAAMSTPSGITLNAVVNLDASVRGGIGSATKGAIDYAQGMGK